MKLKLSTFVLFLLCLTQVPPAFAQDTDETRDIAVEPSGAARSPAGAPGGQSAPKKFVPGQFTLDLLKDQKQLWTAPFRLHFSDTAWLVPLSGITAGLLVTDTDVSKNMSRDPEEVVELHHAFERGGCRARGQRRSHVAVQLPQFERALAGDRVVRVRPHCRA